MKECKQLKPIEVCPVCSKGPREELAAALDETLAQIERLKAQARVFKRKLKAMDKTSTEPAEKPAEA